jgi:hypothetical protein
MEANGRSVAVSDKRVSRATKEPMPFIGAGREVAIELSSPNICGVPGQLMELTAARTSIFIHARDETAVRSQRQAYYQRKRILRPSSQTDLRS